MSTEKETKLQDDIFIWSARYNLSLIVKFYDELRQLLENKMDDINALLEDELSREQEIDYKVEKDFYIDYADSYLRINTFLMAYSHTEEYLYHVWRKYASTCELKSQRGSIKRFKPILKGLGLELSTAECWSFICDAETFRNCLLHANGRISLSKNPDSIRKAAKRNQELVSIKTDRLRLSDRFVINFLKSSHLLINTVKQRSTAKIRTFMNEEEFIEQYNFYMLADTDMNLALNTLKMIRRYKKGDIINALIRDLIVTYSRPFMNCRGTIIDKHRLHADTFVPKKLHALHKKILKYRNQIFAHTDLTARKPKLGRLPIGKTYRYGMSFRGFPPKDFKRDLPRIEEILHNVRENISSKLKEIEKELDLIT